MRPANMAGLRPLLVVLCGPSHSGKSTFACRLSETSQDFTLISTDRIRRRLSVGFDDPEYESKVWDIYESLKQKALRQGKSVILDACHISEQARQHSIQGPNAGHRKICVVFDLPFRAIHQRCLKSKRVPLQEAKRMWVDFQKTKPSAEELKQLGFDEVHFTYKARQICRPEISTKGGAL